jgi:hypothetical protein
MRVRGGVVGLQVLLVVASACRPSADAQREDLCGDLGHLRATIDFLSAPPDDASVGEVRSDLDKLDPTFGAMSASGTVPHDVVRRLIAEHEAYRETIEGVGDDDRFAAVRDAAEVPADGLANAFGSVVAALGCAPSSPA